MGSRFLLVCIWLLGVQSLLSSCSPKEVVGKPGYQSLQIESTTTTPACESASTQVYPEGTWSLGLLHRDEVSSRQSASLPAHTVLAERLKRDAARVDAINQRVQLAVLGINPTTLKPSETSSQVSAADFTSPIISGISAGSGEYFTRLGIGTPPKQSYFVVDTGSDVSWTQCSPCSKCYKQNDPVFNPAASSSYRNVGCGTPICSQLLISACRSTQCLYQVSYGDGSFTVGNFATESFTFGGATLRNVAIGCGHDNEGLFVGASGLLGMGGGRLSFPTQIKSVFSYCLADRFTGGSSSLVFGPGAVPQGALVTSMLRNPKVSTFYYVPLLGMSVGGTQLSISPSEFSLQSTGEGGVILDSGTSITRLVSSAYASLRDAFKAGARNLPAAASFSLFDTCFSLGGATSVDVPTVELHFGNGATLALPANNYLIPVDTRGTYCFGFAPSSSSLSIIGNMQQQGYRVAFNAQGSQISFTPKQC